MAGMSNRKGTALVGRLWIGLFGLCCPMCRICFPHCTHDGKKVKKVWERRRLEEWKDDIRWNTEDKPEPELVLHPIVDPPPKHEKEGLSYSKAWQAQFWDDYGRVAGEDVTLEECGRKEAIICRNILVAGRVLISFACTL